MNINDIYIRDAFMYVEGDTCYLVGTTDKNAWNGTAHGFLGYKTKDLVNFEGPFTLFKNDHQFWATEHYWAPELHKINGKYYLLASFHTPGHRRACQALVSDTPFGTYKPLERPFTPEEWECLDATIYEDGGVKYCIFCHEWTQVGDGEMCLGIFNDDLTSLHDIKVLFHASDAKWVKAYKPDGINAKYITDGPFIHKTKNDRLLMLWSSLSETGYAEGIAYSDNGINGEWKQMDEPLFKDNGGHGMVFTFKDKLYFINHINNDKPLQERALIQEVIEENNTLVIKR